MEAGDVVDGDQRGWLYGKRESLGSVISHAMQCKTSKVVLP